MWPTSPECVYQLAWTSAVRGTQVGASEAWAHTWLRLLSPIHIPLAWLLHLFSSFILHNQVFLLLSSHRRPGYDSTCLFSAPSAKHLFTCLQILAQIVSSKQSEVEGKQGEKIRLLKTKNTSHRIARKFGNCDSRGQHQIHVSVGHFDSVHVDRTSI